MNYIINVPINDFSNIIVANNNEVINDPLSDNIT